MNILRSIAEIIVITIVLLSVAVLGSVAAIYYENMELDLSENNSGLAKPLVGKDEKKEEPNFTCLFMGRNAHLTDFIMLGQYNPNTRNVSLMSIPRDTNVGNASVDGKINSIYRYKYPEKVVAEVQKITGVEIQHYLIFDAKILRKIVDELGGVTVNVPINMNYDDPEQNLYIHLKKGVQKLTGKQAEQFVRFRKNNDDTGYPNGDIGRIAAQQSFIKAMAAEVLKVENIGKVSNLVNIVLDGTDTDITLDVVSKYLDDVVTFKTDRIRVETLPGAGKYAKGPDGYTRSFYFHNSEETKTLVNDLFFKKESLSGDTTIIENSDAKDNNDSTEVISSNLEVNSDEKIRIEVLNAKAKSSKLNSLVEKLNENECNVVKIGNYESTKTESSRIITYGKHTKDELDKVKELSGINKIEESLDKSTVKFTIILGAAY